jgi:hypothetical protein
LSRDLAGSDAAAALERARATPQARLIRGLRLLSDALAAARGSGNARLEIETAALRFILQHEDPSLDALAARVGALESGAGVGPAAPAAAAGEGVVKPVRPASNRPAADPIRPAPASAKPTAPVAEPPAPSIPPVGDLSLHKIRSLWRNVRARAESARRTLSAPLSRTTIAAFDGDVLTLSVLDRTNADVLKGSLATLRTALDGVLGRSLEIRIIVDNGRAPLSPAAPNGADDETADLVRYAIDTLP